MTTRYNENVAEQALLEWLNALGYEVLHGPDIAPGEPGEERGDYGETLLRGRLRAALVRLKSRSLLMEHREIADPDHGGSYTVKVYERVGDDEVLLRPDTTSSGYEPIRLIASDADEVRVIAELVEVLPGDPELKLSIGSRLASRGRSCHAPVRRPRR